MDDTTVDTSDTEYDDSGSSSETSYSSSSDSESSSASSSSYYDDDCPDSGDAASSGDSDGVDTLSSSDDDSDSGYSDDTSTEPSTETSAETPAEVTNGDTMGSDLATTGGSVTDATVTSDPVAATPVSNVGTDCPPAFPLTGVAAAEGTTAPSTVAPAAAVAPTDAGTPTDTGATESGAPAGFVTPTAGDGSGAPTHVAYPETADLAPTAPSSGNDGYVPPQQAPPFQGIPHGILSPAQEQAFVQTGWTPALVPDGHGGQVEVLQPANVDPTTYQGQVQFLQSHLQNLVAQQQGASAQPATAAPVAGATPVTSTPVAFDAAGRPTHVVSSNVVNTTTTQTFGGNNPLYSNGQWMGGEFPQGTTWENFGGAMRIAPGAPSPTVDPYTAGGAAQWDLRLLNNQITHAGGFSTTHGVTTDPMTGTSYGDGRPFDNRPDALGAERNPEGPAPR